MAFRTFLDWLTGAQPPPRLQAQASLVWTRRDWTAGFVQNLIGRYGDLNRNGFEVDAYYPTNVFVGCRRRSRGE